MEETFLVMKSGSVEDMICDRTVTVLPQMSWRSGSWTRKLVVWISSLTALPFLPAVRNLRNVS